MFIRAHLYFYQKLEVQLTLIKCQTTPLFREYWKITPSSRDIGSRHWTLSDLVPILKENCICLKTTSKRLKLQHTTQGR